MLLADHFPPTLPAALQGRLTTRLPLPADVTPVAVLLTAAARRYDPEAAADEAALRSRMVGLKSWARRQVVVVPTTAEGTASLELPPLAWIALEDRASGRTNVQFVISAEAPEREALAAALLDWAVEVGGSFARARGVETTKLTTDANELDRDRQRLLEAAGYEMVRSWLHMRRPVAPEDATTLPAPREGTRVRRVHRHDSGLPVAQDVRTVHRMLEESFADHFNSYRESFAEFVQRLIEDPGEADWDHWWIAEIEREGRWLPAGGLVAAPIRATATRGQGTYLEYLGCIAAPAAMASRSRCCAPRSGTRPNGGGSSSTSRWTTTPPPAPTGSTPRWAGRPSNAPAPGTRPHPRTPRACSSRRPRPETSGDILGACPRRERQGTSPPVGRRRAFQARRRGSGRPAHSHSMVPGGLDVISRVTRLISRTSLVMRVEMRLSTS